MVCVAGLLPGERMPPLATTTLPWIVPEPPSAAPEAILTVAARLARSPRTPLTTKVPALTLNVPVKPFSLVLLPVSVSVLARFFCTVPAPPKTLARVSASLRLSSSCAPPAIETLPVPRLPVVPPSPICRLPPVMLVVPV